MSSDESRSRNKADPQLFARLLEERARLSLTQQQVAEFAQVSIKTVRRWEKSIAIPMSAAAALIRKGFDVQYVSCGVRSENLHKTRDQLREDGALYDVPPAATPGEVEILRQYRSLDTQQRAQVHLILSALTKRAAQAGGDDSTPAMGS